MLVDLVEVGVLVEFPSVDLELSVVPLLQEVDWVV